MITSDKMCLGAGPERGVIADKVLQSKPKNERYRMQRLTTRVSKGGNGSRANLLGKVSKKESVTC